MGFRDGTYCLILILAAAFTSSCSKPVSAPQSFETYHASTGEFQCEYPAGWEAEGGGKKILYANFTYGPAGIHVDSSTTVSLLGDIAGSGGGGADDEYPDLAPAAQMHELTRAQAEEDYGGYVEIGEPQILQNRLGEARMSQFTASGTFGGATHGYRATILGKDKAWLVICKCPESDWKTLEPAFNQVLESFARGQR